MKTKRFSHKVHLHAGVSMTVVQYHPADLFGEANARPVGFEWDGPSGVFIADIKVGKNSETASAGHFDARLLNGKKHRMELCTPVMAVSATLDNFGKEPVKGTFTFELEETKEPRRQWDSKEAAEGVPHTSILPLTSITYDPPAYRARISLQEFGSWYSIESRTQVGGIIRELWASPDDMDSVCRDKLRVVASVIDVDRDGKDVPETRRLLALEPAADRFRVVGNGELWPGEKVLVEVEKSGVNPPWAFFSAAKIDVIPSMCKLTGPRYKGRILDPFKKKSPEEA